MNDFFDTYKKRYGHYYCLHHYLYNKKTHSSFPQIYEKIIKSYFNIWYINFFFLLQKNIKLNKNISSVYNVNVLTNIFINICDNSSIDCNKKNKNKIYDLYNNIINSNRYKNDATIYLEDHFITNTHHVDRLLYLLRKCFCVLISIK